MSPDEPGWAAVAEKVRARMTKLRLSQGELKRRSKVSDAKIRQLLNEHQPIVTNIKRAQLCNGLGWTDDSIDRILRGEDPVLSSGDGDDEERDRRLDEVEQKIAALGLQIAELVDEVRGRGSDQPVPQ